MVRSSLLAGLAVSLLTIGSVQAQAKKASSGSAAKDDVAALQKLVEDSMAAWDRKDAAWFDANTAHDADMVNFGTDAPEYWVGWEPFRAAMKKQFDALESGKTKVRDVRVKIHVPGRVASVTYLLDATGVSGGQKFAIEGMRNLIVAEKRKGRWLMTSGHASIPVSGQAVKY